MIDTQIEIGTRNPFYTLDPELHGYGTANTRWKYTWYTSRENDIRIEINNMWLPRTTYDNDACIMEIAVHDRQYQGKNAYKLKTINQCRMYQQSFFIGDLLNNDEKTVNKGYLDGSRQHVHESIKNSHQCLNQRCYNGGNGKASFLETF